jgi:Na+/proline symporter
MQVLDYTVILVFMLGILFLGLYFAKRAGKNSTEFVLSGRKLPWWLAGISMSAQGFNADSPIHQTSKLRQTGMQGMWFYWSQIIYFISGSIIFARLWRRTKLTTPIEYYHLRYHGIGSHIARIYWTLLIAFGMTLIPMVMGLLALRKLFPVLFDLPATFSLAGMTMQTDIAIVLGFVALAMAYSAASGMWGIVATDFIEFIIAIGCSYILTFIVYRQVGWASGLREGLAALKNSGVSYLKFTPAWGFILFAWWVLMPLTRVQCNGATALRFMAVKDERQAVLTGVWQVITHFIVRGWPWYVAGVITLILVPSGFGHEKAYPYLVRNFLPVGLKGLMVAGFIAAFMSSIDTAMHASSSMFMNDLYRPYIKKDATEKHYVFVARVAIIVYTILGCSVALKAQSVLKTVMLFIKLGSAGGFVVVLRWFWWRVNIWADISAMVAGAPLTLIFNGKHSPSLWFMNKLGLSGMDNQFAFDLFFIIAINTVLWITVMYLTKPEPMEKLKEFYTRVRPYGFWGPVAKLCPKVKVTDKFSRDILTIAMGIFFAYSLLFCIGFLFFGIWKGTLILIIPSVFAGIFFIKRINRHYAGQSD